MLDQRLRTLNFQDFLKLNTTKYNFQKKSKKKEFRSRVREVIYRAKKVRNRSFVIRWRNSRFQFFQKQRSKVT